MPLFFWDASALAKRYTAETGWETANALFRQTPPLNMASTPWGYAETYSILLRRLNGGVLDSSSFTAAITSLQNEVAEGFPTVDPAALPAPDVAVFLATL